jgi:hypothetical protein
MYDYVSSYMAAVSEMSKFVYVHLIKFMIFLLA